MTVQYRPMKRIDFLVVHCAATKPSMDIGVKEIRLWHRQQGWLDVGYHYVIRRSGEVEKGRPDDRPGAHASQVNDRSIGICLVGGIDAKGKAENNFTNEQFAALRTLLYQLRCLYPEADVIGHRDIPGVAKDCPSFCMKTLWKEWNTP